MNIANDDNYALTANDIDTTALCSAPDNLPAGFSWVRWTPMFRYAWDEITRGGHEIVTVLGQGGSGKSVLLEMVYSLSPARTLVPHSVSSRTGFPHLPYTPLSASVRRYGRIRRG